MCYVCICAQRDHRHKRCNARSIRRKKEERERACGGRSIYRACRVVATTTEREGREGNRTTRNVSLSLHVTPAHPPSAHLFHVGPLRVQSNALLCMLLLLLLLLLLLPLSMPGNPLADSYLAAPISPTTGPPPSRGATTTTATPHAPPPPRDPCMPRASKHGDSKVCIAVYVSWTPDCFMCSLPAASGGMGNSKEAMLQPHCLPHVSHYRPQATGPAGMPGHTAQLGQLATKDSSRQQPSETAWAVVVGTFFPRSAVIAFTY